MPDASAPCLPRGATGFLRSALRCAQGVARNDGPHCHTPAPDSSGARWPLPPSGRTLGRPHARATPDPPPAEGAPLSTLETAIAIAAQAHAGQVDKGGAPYILHPLRVMLRVDGAERQMAAVLHDVVEDTAWTLDALRQAGFGEAVLTAIDHLTRREGEDYLDFVRRAARDPIAAAVKRADLLENSDLTRLLTVTDRDRERLARYAAALALLDDAPTP
ncbi:MAG: HD domain-containing protein [Gemmatimonadales bacterium]